MRMRIEIHAPDGRLLAFPFTGGVATVGRAPNSDVRVRSQAFSWRHLLLRRSGSGVLVEDVGSSTGSEYQGAPLLRESAVPLAFGEPVIVGGFRVVVQPSDAPLSETAVWVADSASGEFDFDDVASPALPVGEVAPVPPAAVAPPDIEIRVPEVLSVGGTEAAPEGEPVPAFANLLDRLTGVDSDAEVQVSLEQTRVVTRGASGESGALESQAFGQADTLVRPGGPGVAAVEARVERSEHSRIDVTLRVPRRPLLPSVPDDPQDHDEPQLAPFGDPASGLSLDPGQASADPRGRESTPWKDAPRAPRGGAPPAWQIRSEADPEPSSGPAGTGRAGFEQRIMGRPAASVVPPEPAAWEEAPVPQAERWFWAIPWGLLLKTVGLVALSMSAAILLAMLMEMAL